MIRVSAIVPTYNRSALITDAINAILAQSYPVHEVIVVDDGSTDETAATVAALPGPIRSFRQENGGKSSALNNGLSHVTGDYVWICDDDDIALPHALGRLVAAIPDDKPAFAFGQLKKFYIDSVTGERVVEPTPFYWPMGNGKSVWLNLLEDFFVFQNATIVATAAYDAVGPFRTDLIRSQDYEMVLRLARRFPAYPVPEVVFLQREHAGERGSAADAFSQASTPNKSVEYNQKFFRELYTILPLSAFRPSGTFASEALAVRASLLQRASVFGRKKMWTHAAADLSAAGKIAMETPASDDERAICEAATLSGYGCRELLEKEVQQILCDVARKGGLETAFIQAITEPLLWYARKSALGGHGKEAARFAAALICINGIAGAGAVLARKFIPQGLGHPRRFFSRSDAPKTALS
jgi:glycosyltransferase involved in cell wall biosynthesis